MTHHTARKTISDEFTDEVCARLGENKRIRRTLPEGGRLHIDRQLPFLCVYRRPADRTDAGTERLVVGEPSFMIAPGGASFRKSLSALVRRIAGALAARFGAFLLVEVWSKRDLESIEASSGPSTDWLESSAAAVTVDTVGGAPIDVKPGFRIAARGPNKPRKTVDVLEKALRRIKILRLPADVDVDDRGYGHPPGMPLLISPADARQLGCRVVGLQVRPVYRDPNTGEIFPATLGILRRGLSRALKQAFFTFARIHTSVRPQHYYSLGRRAMVKAVWEVDRRLADVSDSFDFLLQVTPVNAEMAWRQFKRDLSQRCPEFVYRPLVVEPAQLKRRLFEIPIERIEDPTLAHLFRERQDELDRKITMLCDVGTPRFLLGSLQVYGDIQPPLLNLATELLQSIPSRSRDALAGRQLSAQAFADRALQEIEYYRRGYRQFRATVAVRGDLYSGLLVSGGDLLIGRQARIPAGRVEALLQHEIGTHLVTYYNGHAQPFRQLCIGLAGYDVLQEGIAVLAEYLVGGFSRPRARVLAARVVAAQQLIDGASFVDTFRLLSRDYGFPQRAAFTITMRVYRGGGLTKDAVYLRGLVEILEYLKEGGALEPLLVGKIAPDHVRLVRELQLRQILRSPPLRPRYMDNPQVSDKLLGLRDGRSVGQLIEGHKK